MKKKTVALAIVLLAAVLCGAAVSLAGQPAIPPDPRAAAATPGPEAVAQGARLAAVGDCMGCHTAKGGQPFAGGLPIDTPFGKIFSTNITPDPETGIGNWTPEAFARAMRKGVSRDGHLLYPAFPYNHFQHMTDADIGFLYAYLMRREPVRASAPANRLMFPLNFRPLMAGWNMLFLHRDMRQGMQSNAAAAEAVQGADLQRGRYLVDGPAHCAACHTPLNMFGAEKKGQAFAGGFIDGWDAPPLTTLLRSPKPWTQQQLAQYLRTGLADEHGAAAGPMRPVARSLGDASEDDVNAIAAYLMTLQAPAPTTQGVGENAANSATNSATNSAANSAADAPSLQSGAMLFSGSCAACHAPSAPMSVAGGRPLLGLSTSLNADRPRNAVRMILDGMDWDGSRGAHFMPAFADMLTDAQIADLANYARIMFAKRAAWPALDADAVAKIRKETPKP
ncbi:cytochrome c [Oxalobacteraceae bacterium CAVE-383]|nr:cytochrome c [Oxalobacteraceae bacterium CAVE-383]